MLSEVLSINLLLLTWQGLLFFFFLLFFLINLASTKEDEGHENIEKILYNLIIKSDTTGVY